MINALKYQPVKKLKAAFIILKADYAMNAMKGFIYLIINAFKILYMILNAKSSDILMKSVYYAKKDSF